MCACIRVRVHVRVCRGRNVQVSRLGAALGVAASTENANTHANVPRVSYFE